MKLIAALPADDCWYSTCMTRLVSFVIVTMLSCIAGGCTGIKSPTVEVISAALGEQTDEAITLRMGLRLRNPNNEPLSLLEFDYRVEVDGREAFRGRRSAQMTLSRLSTRDVEIPAVVTLGESGWHADALRSGQAQVRIHGSLRYLAPGAISQTLFDTGISKPRARFSGEKPLQVPRSARINSVLEDDDIVNPS